MTDYNPTHQSYHDGSEAMLVRERGGMVRMENECGDQWSDPAWWWIPVADVSPADVARWDALWDDDDYPPSQSGAEFMASYYNSDSYINYLNGH